ncbi:MAG: discoidin domain-containing protein, partial [Acidaminobacteraceae bacterium]
ILTRKYPVFDWWDSRTLEMKNGRFQASNNPDFSYATTVYTIKEAPEMKYHTIKIDKQYRYWRYVAAETSYGDIAEIEFISFQDKPISGNIIGTKGFDPEFDKAAVFDNKPLTYYQGATSGNNWVGMDFGEPKTVKTIRFLGRNDDNFINHDDNYELYYWKNNQWISLGKRKDTDKSNTLIYKNAPMGVLFLLRNHTKGREERVFTYMNNQQIWW